MILISFVKFARSTIQIILYFAFALSVLCLESCGITSSRPDFGEAYWRMVAFYEKGKEADGYGAYTYVLFSANTEGNRTFLRTLLRGTDTEKSAPKDRSLKTFNTFLVPIVGGRIKEAYLKSAKANVGDKELRNDVGVTISALYDYSLARSTLRNSCDMHKNVILAKDCSGDGPFLVVYSVPIWSKGASPRYIINLSSVSSRTYGKIINDFTSPETASELENNIADIIHWFAESVEGIALK